MVIDGDDDDDYGSFDYFIPFQLSSSVIIVTVIIIISACIIFFFFSDLWKSHPTSHPSS